MKVSVFTPTHNPAYLLRARDSLSNQTYKNFEWIVGPNNGARVNEEELKRGIPNLKVINLDGYNGIGMLKNLTTKACSGEILVELDHDDELTPDCLQTVVEEFTKDKELDFVYSNSCDLDKEGATIHFDINYGWKYLPFRDGLFQTVSFAPSPASFGKIWFAPDHVRAWRSNFYHRIGGHDKNLIVLDDHDLMCRTYIHGKVRHINKCLYIYHLHDENTFSKRRINNYIQLETSSIYEKYIESMVSKWCKLKGLREITLKGDSINRTNDVLDPQSEWIKSDWSKIETASVGVFHANQALPYLSQPVQAMEQIYRCLAPGGWLLSATPSTDGSGAFMNPNYKSYWNANSFLYYTNENFANKIKTTVKFKCYHMNKMYYPEKWYLDANIPFVSADLYKYPPCRTPGLVEFKRPVDEIVGESYEFN